jgi:TPR repeat protein
VAQDDAEAIRWFELAARQGLREAQAKLAEMRAR